jgi:uncharacterized protein (DUF952 family)
MLVYHIVFSEIWDRFSGDDYESESLGTEGFIHCSFPEQIEGVIDRYYRGAKNLAILEIDTTKLRSKLVVEPSTGGEDYPHIYGPMNRDAIVRIKRRRNE